MNEYDAKITNIFPTPLFFPYITYIVYIAEKVSELSESMKIYIGYSFFTFHFSFIYVYSRPFAKFAKFAFGHLSFRAKR